MTELEVSKMPLLQKILFEIKEDTKKPKRNFMSGMIAGFLLSSLAQAKGALEGDEDTDLAEPYMKMAMDNIKQLVETFHWKRTDIIQFITEFKDALTEPIGEDE